MRNTRKLIEKKYLSDKLVQNQEAKPQQEKTIQPTPPDTEREHLEPPQKQYNFFIDNLKRISPFPNKRHRGYFALCSSTAFGTLHSPIWELTPTEKKNETEKCKTILSGDVNAPSVRACFHLTAFYSG
jgi:hypothetical protein